jgi:hypothetical protein
VRTWSLTVGWFGISSVFGMELGILWCPESHSD